MLDLRIERQSTPSRVADALREAILRGDLMPGAPLREAAICASAGVSRNTVREAMRLLMAEGLVSHSTFRGVSVAVLGESDVADIFRARLAQELAGVEALPGASDEQLAALQRAADDFAAAVDCEDWDEAFRCDISLHAGLVELVGSRRFHEGFLTLMRELRLGYLVFGGRETEALPIEREEHGAIAEAAARRDHAACAVLVTAHLGRSQQLLMDLMHSRPPAAATTAGAS